jgi:hypothetical protein
MIILFGVWCFLGAICLGLARIKVPNDTQYGKDNPIEAWISWAIMITTWPNTLKNRKKFALYGDPKDENNPSWLSQS